MWGTCAIHLHYCPVRGRPSPAAAMTTLRGLALVWAMALTAAFSAAVHTRSVIAWVATVILAVIPVMLAWGLATAPTKTVAEIIHDAESR